MRIKVELLFPFREELDEKLSELELPAGADVAAAVAALVEQYPALRARLFGRNGRLARFVSALVNGTSIQFLNGLATPLSDGDRLTLLPPVGGG